MVSEAPPFWWQPTDWRARALWPAAKIYGSVAAHRLRQAARVPIDVPVLCIGNFTVGGTGKTPTAIAFARLAKACGLVPGVVSRGHGGRSEHPRIVDAQGDTAKQVGDEPLLIAQHVPIAISPNRAAAAKLLLEQGCDFLIMDDGLQSARIHIDFALAIVDCRHGVGNGKVIPAGPLRAPLAEQLRHVSAVLTMGKGDAADAVVRRAARAGRPVYQAFVRTTNAAAIARGRYFAFAGIGHPERFFDSVRQAGGEVVQTRVFPDHHVYTMDELLELDATASKAGLALITTAKDQARLRHGNLPPLFLSKMRVLEIETVFDDPTVPERILAQTIAAYRER